MTSPSYRSLTGTGPENYERYFVPTIAAAVSTDLLKLADVQPGERVVDVACGTGLIARQVASLVGKTGTVSGIDLSSEMIDVAKSMSLPAGTHVDWYVTDAASLPLPDSSCDV